MTLFRSVLRGDRRRPTDPSRDGNRAPRSCRTSGDGSGCKASGVDEHLNWKTNDRPRARAIDWRGLPVFQSPDPSPSQTRRSRRIVAGPRCRSGRPERSLTNSRTKRCGHRVQESVSVTPIRCPAGHRHSTGTAWAHGPKQCAWDVGRNQRRCREVRLQVSDGRNRSA